MSQLTNGRHAILNVKCEASRSLDVGTSNKKIILNSFKI